MKIKKKSIIIPAFALLIGASLAGSISGTVAWYQFSTRASAAYVGVSGGTVGNLKIRLGTTAENKEWLTRLTFTDVADYLADLENTNPYYGYGTNIIPITSGAMDKEASLNRDGVAGDDFYLNPIYRQGGAYSKWQKAGKANYVKIPLQLCYVERDGVVEGGADAKYLAKDVFLSDLLIQEDHTNADYVDGARADLSDAIRFHVSAFADGAQEDEKVNRLISKKGGTTLTNGKLDLDGDGILDADYVSDKYGFSDTTQEDIVYGVGSQVAFSNETAVRAGTYYDSEGNEHDEEKVYPMVVKGVGDSLDIDEDSKEYDAGKSKSIGKTVASNSEFLNVEITIWVEGWQALEDENGDFLSIWDDDYLNSKFDVGFEFAVDPVLE